MPSRSRSSGSARTSGMHSSSSSSREYQGDDERSPLLTYSPAESSSLLSEHTDLETQGDAPTPGRGVRRLRVDARIISDATIGLSDGLTVPFALTAGLSALGNTKVVIYGGFAELIAGAISMGLGGYLGAKSEA